MLSLETRDTWAFSVTVTVGASSDTLATTCGSAYATIAALIAWANAAGRPWFGMRTFAWSWARDTATCAAKLTLSATGAFSIDAGTYATLGLDAASAVTSVTGRTVALGTWAPAGHVGVSAYYREMEDDGDAAASGAIRPGSPARGLFTPQVVALGSAQDAARLTYLLGQASNPRRGWFRRQDANVWVYLAVGEVGRSQVDGTLYSWTFDARGHA